MTWNVVPKKNLKPLVWEAQKLFSGYYYAPLSEDNKVHMQLVDESEGYVEPLIDQRLYCDMRPHVETQVEGDRVRACLFAIGERISVNEACFDSTIEEGSSIRGGTIGC